MFVDSDHAVDKVSHRSSSVFLYLYDHHIVAVVLKEAVYSRDISLWN